MAAGTGLGRVVRVGVVLALVGYGGYYAYNELLQPDEIRRRVVEELAKKFDNCDIEIGSARMRPFLGGINVSDLKLIRRDDPTRTPFLHVPKAIIWHDKTDFVHRFSPAKIELEDAHIRIIRDAAGRWNLADVIHPPDGEPTPILVFKKAKVEVVDQPSGSSAVLDFQELDISVVNDPARVFTFEAKGKSTPLGPFAAKGRYEIGQGANGTLELGGITLGPDLARLAGLCATECVEHLRTITGQASSRTKWTWKPGGQFGCETEFDLTNGRCTHPDLPAVLEQLALKGKFKNGELTIDNLTARLGECGLSVKLEIDAPNLEPGSDPMIAFAAGIEDRVRRLEVTVTDLNFGPELFDKLLPKLPAKFAEVRDMFRPAGPADITYAQRREKAGLRKTCVVRPKGMSAIYRGFQYPADEIRGTIEATLDEDLPPRYEIDLVGEAGHKAVTLKGRVTGGADREVDLVLTGSDIVLDKTLIDALPDEYPKVVRKLRPTARGDFTAKIRHNARIRRDHGPEVFDNEFDIKVRAGSVNYEEFPYMLKSLMGQLLIRTVPDLPTMRPEGRPASGEIGSLTIKEFTATGSGGCKLKINGGRGREPGGSVLDLKVVGESLPLDGELYRAIAKLQLHKSWQSFEPTGRMNCEMHVRLHDRDAGPGKPPVQFVPARDLELGMAFNGPSLKPAFFQYQLTDAAGQVAFAGGRVDLQQFRAKHGNVSITLPTAKVLLPPAGGFWADLYDLRINPLVFDAELLHALPGGLRSAALGLEPRGPIMAHAKRLVIDGQLKDRPRERELPQLAGTSGVVRASLAPPPDRETLPTIYWDGSLTFRDASLKTGVAWDGVTGQITARGLYLGDRLGRVVADLAFESGRLLKQPIEGVSARFEVDPARPDIVEVPWINAKAYGGEVGGEARLELGTPLKFHLKLNGSKLKLEEFARINQLGPKTHVEGLATAQITLSNPLDPLTRQPVLNGSGSIDVPNGKMLDMPILLDVIKLAKLRPMDRTLFEEAHAVFRIRGNRLKFGQLDLIGTAVSLGGEGEMDSDGKNAQFEFYTVWTNIRNILGVTGELPSRISSNLFRIKVTGNLGDEKPRVTQEPLPAIIEPVKRLLGRTTR